MLSPWLSTDPYHEFRSFGAELNDHRFCRQSLYISKGIHPCTMPNSLYDHLDVKPWRGRVSRGLLAVIRYPDIDLNPSRAIHF